MSSMALGQRTECPSLATQRARCFGTINSAPKLTTRLAFSSPIIRIPHQQQKPHRTKRSTNSLVVSAALGGLLGGIFGTGTDYGESTRQQYANTVAVINQMEPEISSLSDSELRDKTSALQKRAQSAVASGQSLDSLLPV